MCIMILGEGLKFSVRQRSFGLRPLIELSLREDPGYWKTDGADQARGEVHRHAVEILGFV